jgi:hypothetical protein
MSPHHTVLTLYSSRLDSLELMENPTCADLRAGPSFVPSPIAMTIERAVGMLSPVYIFTATPAF